MDKVFYEFEELVEVELDADTLIAKVVCALPSGINSDYKDPASIKVNVFYCDYDITEDVCTRDLENLYEQAAEAYKEIFH